MRVALWILAVLANLTVLERLVAVWRQLRGRETGEPSEGSSAPRG